MHYKRNILLLVLLLCLQSSVVFGQLDNRAFYDVWTTSKTDSGAIKLEIPTTFYLKNNEYFGAAADGYTLFGWQALPRISYQVNPRLRLAGGALLQQDFGADTLRKVRPYYSATYTINNHYILTLGGIEGGLAHNIIEPMFDFERTINRRVEEGLQLKRVNDSLTFDLWIDWLRRTEAFTGKKEQLFTGLNLRKAFTAKGKTRYAAIFQATIFHEGGQIDTAGGGAFSKANLVGGIQAIQGNWIFEFYAMHGRNLSGERVFQELDNGFAWYTNISYRKKHLNIMLSHFLGNYFQAPMGGALYQSQTRSVKQPQDLIFSQRHLVFIRAMYDLPIGKGAFLTLRAEPYYDIVKSKAEYSFGCYINVPLAVLLKK